MTSTDYPITTTILLLRDEYELNIFGDFHPLSQFELLLLLTH
jgi:hypothetical protein